MAAECLGNGAECAGEEDVIAIQPAKKVACGAGKTPIDCGSLTVVGFTDPPTQFAVVPLKNRATTIGGTTIQNHVL
jgi:hypothetical protein